MLEAARTRLSSAAIPVRSGIGLRAPHVREITDSGPDLGWVEVHSENYFGDGGQPHHWLERIRTDYPLSLHGVGLGLGSVDPLDLEHLEVALIESLAADRPLEQAYMRAHETQPALDLAALLQRHVLGGTLISFRTQDGESA
jgi:hypothetical protein